MLKKKGRNILNDRLRQMLTERNITKIEIINKLRNRQIICLKETNYPITRLNSHC